MGFNIAFIHSRRTLFLLFVLLYSKYCSDILRKGVCMTVLFNYMCILSQLHYTYMQLYTTRSDQLPNSRGVLVMCDLFYVIL